MNEYIQSDLYRYYGKVTKYIFIRAYFKNSTFRFQVALRLCQSSQKTTRILGRILWFFNRTKKVIKIPVNTHIGYGLYMGHGGPIVVNPSTIIGNNVNLSHFTTIGSNEGKNAVIGDNTYIGPSVCIVEDVCIGSNVTIGAGSVVTKDIPDNATAVGNYAKVINYNEPGKYIKNKWIKKGG